MRSTWGSPDWKSFPVRSAAHNVVGPDASKAQVTPRNSEAVPRATALERYVPLCRFGKTRETSSMRASTDDTLVLSAITSIPTLTS